WCPPAVLQRPLNRYMGYVQQLKPIMAGQNPGIKAVDLIKKHQWRSMSPEQKQPFQEASLWVREQFKKTIHKKKDLTNHGKPKRPCSPFSIFMSEPFEEARVMSQAKMKSLLEEWRNLFSHEKKVYTQLAEDDKIYHMVEIEFSRKEELLCLYL
uniref:Transcription factor A, mitochondrial n=1 Tax=Amphilophus citrinellus TaxID=61819 RepID=A0A3Q0RXS4_AMPCI